MTLCFLKFVLVMACFLNAYLYHIMSTFNCWVFLHSDIGNKNTCTIKCFLILNKIFYITIYVAFAICFLMSKYNLLQKYIWLNYASFPCPSYILIHVAKIGKNVDGLHLSLLQGTHIWYHMMELFMIPNITSQNK